MLFFWLTVEAALEIGRYQRGNAPLEASETVKYAADVCEQDFLDSTGVGSAHVAFELGLLVEII